MKIAICARTSTREQSLDNQLVPLREYTVRRGAEAVEFTDQASGSSAARESLAILLEAAKRQEFDAVAVVKLDRLGAQRPAAGGYRRGVRIPRHRARGARSSTR